MDPIVDLRTPEEIAASSLNARYAAQRAAIGGQAAQRVAAPAGDASLLPGMAAVGAGAAGAYGLKRGIDALRGRTAAPAAGPTPATFVDVTPPPKPTMPQDVPQLGRPISGSPSGVYPQNAPSGSDVPMRPSLGQVVPHDPAVAAAAKNAETMGLLGRGAAGLGRGLMGALKLAPPVALGEALLQDVGLHNGHLSPEEALGAWSKPAYDASNAHTAQLQAQGASPAALLGARLGGAAKVVGNQVLDNMGVSWAADTALPAIGDFFSGLTGGGAPAQPVQPAAQPGQPGTVKYHGATPEAALAAAVAGGQQQPAAPWGHPDHPAAGLYNMSDEDFGTMLSGMKKKDVRALIATMAPPKPAQSEIIANKLQGLVHTQYQKMLAEAKTQKELTIAHDWYAGQLLAVGKNAILNPYLNTTH